MKQREEKRILVAYNGENSVFTLYFYDLVLPMTLDQLKDVGNQIETTIESYYREKETN